MFPLLRNAAKSGFEKNQKNFKIRFASSQKRCYIMKPIFSGVLERASWLIEN